MPTTLPTHSLNLNAPALAHERLSVQDHFISVAYFTSKGPEGLSGAPDFSSTYTEIHS